MTPPHRPERPYPVGTAARRRRAGRDPVAAVAAVIWLALTACSGDGQSANRDAPAGAASASQGGAGGAAGRSGGPVAGGTPECPQEVLWRPCSVEKRLTDAGFVPVKAPAPAPADVFPVPGASYQLGPAEVHVYLFSSTEERERAVAAIDTVAVTGRGRAAPWDGEPVLITSNNLAAVLLGGTARLVERVQNAFTAGLPPPTR